MFKINFTPKKEKPLAQFFQEAGRRERLRALVYDICADPKKVEAAIVACQSILLMGGIDGRLEEETASREEEPRQSRCVR